MIDHTTLPVIPSQGTITAGQQFTVIGTNFDAWPSELVLGYSSDTIMSEELANSYRLMKLVSKSNTELVFEAQATFGYGTEHLWKYIGTPFAMPRVLLDYTSV